MDLSILSFAVIVIRLSGPSPVPARMTGVYWAYCNPHPPFG